MAKILIVDDEKVVRDLLERTLKTQGYEVSFAKDGLEGLERTKQLLPELIVLDIRMPEINGLSLCHILKNDVKTRHIPILIISGEGKLGVVEDALKEGADGYLTKPFDISRMLEKVDTLLNRNQTSG
jgi:CheY-like chemotaxis protein